MLQLLLSHFYDLREIFHEQRLSVVSAEWHARVVLLLAAYAILALPSFVAPSQTREDLFFVGDARCCCSLRLVCLELYSAIAGSRSDV